jgi:hypothetical protein
MMAEVPCIIGPILELLAVGHLMRPTVTTKATTADLLALPVRMAPTVAVLIIAGRILILHIETCYLMTNRIVLRPTMTLTHADLL